MIYLDKLNLFVIFREHFNTISETMDNGNFQAVNIGQITWKPVQFKQSALYCDIVAIQVSLHNSVLLQYARTEAAIVTRSRSRWRPLKNKKKNKIRAIFTPIVSNVMGVNFDTDRRDWDWVTIEKNLRIKCKLLP